VNCIDVHTHFFPKEWEDLSARFGGEWPWMKHLGGERAMVMMGSREFRPVHSACWDAEKRLEEMGRDGIDLQVMCATPVLFAYGRPADQALYCAQLFNDAALELAARGKGRLKTLCQVPLQDTDAACRELTRAMRAGHLGVQIGNHVGERDLDDEGIVTFLQHCAAEGAAVLVHPWDMMGGARTARWMMAWTVSMPAETQLSIVALILGGAFDRLPKSLRICFAHGGGSFAFLLGRLENAWKNRDLARGKSAQPPGHYLDRFYVDSAVFDPRALRLLVEVMGEDRVVLGSDYPFPLGEQRVGSLIRDMDGLTEVTRKKLLADNALRFFGMNPTPPAA
jgi:aminocarboxymuconate-semialdehyde decarboxylase